MDLNAPVPLEEIEVDVVLRVTIAALIGLLLGIDRETRGHPAGLRTHALVCSTAAIMTVSVLALYNQLDSSRLDALRIFEATGAFVGIIGAGLIVFSRGKVKNLTTAAHIWLTATIGMACGAAQWPLVAVATVTGVFLLTVVGFIEYRWFSGKDETDDAS